VALVVLIGMPGSGKTTLGSAVARRLGVPFVDTDDLVEGASGRTVADIIEEDGESPFRDVELDALRRALNEPAVVATGGGVVTTQAGRDALDGHLCVYLAAGVDVLLERAGRTARPLLAGDPAIALARLSSERGTYYRQLASVELDASRDLDDLANELVAFLKGCD